MTAKVRHAHLWGRREVFDKDSQGRAILTGGKYHWLMEHDVTNTPWAEVESQSPFYLLIPQDTCLLSEYDEGFRIPEISGISLFES